MFNVLIFQNHKNLNGFIIDYFLINWDFFMYEYF
jgi:hypothetical protein